MKKAYTHMPWARASISGQLCEQGAHRYSSYTSTPGAVAGMNGVGEGGQKELGTYCADGENFRCWL